MYSLISSGALLSFFYAYIIYKKKDKKQADYIIISILLVLTINYLLIFFRQDETRTFVPHLLGAAAALILVYGPLIYFYILSYTDRKVITLRNSFPHFIPYLIYVGLNIYYFLNDKIKESNYLEDAYLNGDLTFFYVVTFLKGVHPIIYLVVTLKTVLEHQQNIKKIYSYDNILMNLKWMRYLVISMLVLIAIVIVLNMFRIGKTERIYHLAGEIIMGCATIWVFTVGYYGMKKTPVFISLENPNNPNPKIKYQNTRLDDQIAEKIRLALIKKMEKDKPYLNSKLNISDLAKEIDFPGYQISQVLNDKMGMTFFDFVNNYRVQEMKNKMREENFEQLTLLGNALDSGFNSKASFNRIFKKVVGMTPSEYYKKYHA